LYGYGARYYDPALCRWFVPDPLAERTFSWTPYRYGFNNPILFVDILGLWEDPIKNPQYRGWYGNNWKPGQSKFGKVRGEKYHQGVDLYAKKGTKTVAVEGGTIYQTSDDQSIAGFGNYVVLQFENEDGETRYAVYAHLDEVSVKKDDPLEEGAQIGTTGDSGTDNQSDKEDHLHFEIIKEWWPGKGESGNKKRDNPADYMTIDDASKDDQENKKENSNENEKEDENKK
jgi:murein DD-endopeptidase MepM/ murein hydrolase activator NlpD